MSNTPQEHIDPIETSKASKTTTEQEVIIAIENNEVEKNEGPAKISANSRRHFKYRGTKCLNCSQPLDLTDRYCPYCSQLNSTKPLSLKDFFLEFLSSLVSYDSKLRFTVKDLLFKPGTITRNYINGQRLKYSNPFRFFLSVSIIYFLIYSILGFFNPNAKTPILNFNDGNNDSEVAIKNDNGNFYLDNNNDDLEDAITALEANPSTKKWADKLREADSLHRVEESRKEKDINIVQGDTINKHDYIARTKLLKTKGNVQTFFDKFNIFQDFYKETEIQSAAIALDSLKLPQTKTNIWLYKKNKTIENIEKDPVSFAQFLISKTPFFLFFFAPIYALFFWLVYIRRKATYMEHLIFIFHIFSFIFLVLLLTAIPSILFDSNIFLSILFGIIGPFYFYKALRNFYKQSRIKTILKFVFLNIVFFISASTVASLFFLATAATY